MFEKSYSILESNKAKQENLKRKSKKDKDKDNDSKEKEIDINTTLINTYFNGDDDDFNKSFIETLLSVLKIRENEFGNEAKKRSILAGLPDSLQDFDWSLRLVMSSSQLTTVRIPIVLLTLTIKTGENKIKNVNLQLNKNDLAKFISHLSNCQKVECIHMSQSCYHFCMIWG